jgi:hypothetical protein
MDVAMAIGMKQGEIVEPVRTTRYSPDDVMNVPRHLWM